MKDICKKWEEWKLSPVGKEAILSVDKEASMFQAFVVGIHMAENENMIEKAMTPTHLR
jgi:hypothetical protein